MNDSSLTAEQVDSAQQERPSRKVGAMPEVSVRQYTPVDGAFWLVTSEPAGILAKTFDRTQAEIIAAAFRAFRSTPSLERCVREANALPEVEAQLAEAVELLRWAIDANEANNPDPTERGTPPWVYNTRVFLDKVDTL